MAGHISPDVTQLHSYTLHDLGLAGKFLGVMTLKAGHPGPVWGLT